MSFSKLLGVELPIIQAPMAGVQDSALALAVSSAGGLGSLPCGMLSHDALRAELATIKAQTKKPINLNFFATPPRLLMLNAKADGGNYCNLILTSMGLMHLTLPLARSVDLLAMI